ncbi:MAG: ATP-binding protein [Acidobacteriota bacterium]
MGRASLSRKLFASLACAVLAALLAACLFVLAGLETDLARALHGAAPADASRTAARLLVRRLLSGAGVALVLALTLALYLARRLALPLERLARGAEALSRDGSAVPLPTDRDDDVGRLARAVERLDASARESLETLRTDRNHLLAILAGMVEGVVAVDAGELVVHLNAAAARILRCSATDGVGQRIWELTRVRAVSETLAAALQQGQAVSREANIVQGTDSQILELHAAPLGGGAGGPAGAVVVLHDITNLRRLEEVRTQFVANVSHELKTPLTAITALAETLLDDDCMEAATRMRFLAKVRDQCARLTAMVGDLLDLSRLESHDIRAKFQVVDLRQTVRQAVECLRTEAEQKGVLVLEEAPASAVLLCGDETALSRMLENLLENAIKYTPAGHHVRVRAGETGAEVFVEVEDEGIGIDRIHHARVFERFYRVDQGRSRDVGGTGLGLSIVKHVALAHGGRVTLSSAPGQGSLFRVILPAAASG